jgi:hypothetical protein
MMPIITSIMRMCSVCNRTRQQGIVSLHLYGRFPKIQLLTSADLRCCCVITGLSTLVRENTASRSASTVVAALPAEPSRRLDSDIV